MKTNKNGKINIELTVNQFVVVSDILSRVESVLRWDEDLKQYTDAGDIIVSLDKGDYQALKNAMKQL